MLQIGSLIDNKYKILSEVGHGGMSVVYLAINERANKTWAVKEVRKDGVCDFEAVKQGLIVETDMLKKLDHPYLPSIIDVIDTEDSFLIVMDYIEGNSLQKVLKSGAQPQELVVKWAIQLCDVLGYLHSRTPAIIYRDMKPANVMLKPSGDITLIDFGTAREFKNRSMVEDTTCLGTRGYAAPEQFGGRGQTDARTDIYCLGATMYHLITGHSPAEPPYEIKPLSYWNPVFFETGIERVIAKCCQQDPAHRYQNCAELMYDLENVHLLDEVVIRKRKKKWAAFVAGLALFGVGLAGTIGFSLAKNAAQRDSYDYYIQTAQSYSANENYSDFVDNIKKAVEVDPSRADAYTKLLDRVEADGYLDMQTEWGSILSCLQYPTEDPPENQLLNRDKEAYADVQFRVGKIMFFMSDGSDEDLKSAAMYFDKALENGGMAQSTDPEIVQKSNVAQSLRDIGVSIEGMKKANNLYGDNAFGFQDLYQVLEDLVTNYTIDSLGPKQYGIAMYNRVANLISLNYREMANNGISLDQMRGLLDTIEQALTVAQAEVGSNQVYNDMINGAMTNVITARDRIDAMKGGAG